MTPPPPAVLNARDAVKLPSALVMFTGGLGVLYAASSLAAGGVVQQGMLAVFRAVGLGAIVRDVPAGGSTNIVFPLVTLVLAGLALFGGWQMRGLKSHPLAVTGVLASMLLPPMCCCWGIPAGVWALMVLRKPDVRSQFSRAT